MPECQKDDKLMIAALPPLNAEITASIAVDLAYSRQFDLMLGYHPDEMRHLTEQEERAARWVHLLSQNARLTDSDPFFKALALWRDNWPGYRPTSEAVRDFIEDAQERWRFLLPHCTPIGAVYFFRPTRRSLGEHDEVQRAYNESFEQLRRYAETSPLREGRVTWTTTFPLSDRWRALFEELCGLSQNVKDRLGLDEGPTDFLRRYVTAHDAPIDDLLHPRQFEHLIAEIYRAEGWDCHVTRYSKDDGVDIEARRKVDGEETVLLIQAKRNRSARSARGAPRPVGIDDVKSFAATVSAEGKDSGVVVTSSHFTKGALKWAVTKGQRVASVTLLNGEEVRRKLREICLSRGGDAAAYFLSIAGYASLAHLQDLPNHWTDATEL